MTLHSEPLGTPLPNSPHAASGSMPLWEHAIGYEEKDPKITAAISIAYPRFVLNPFVLELMKQCETEHCQPQETCFVFPSQRVAERANEYLESRTGKRGRVSPQGYAAIHVLAFDAANYDTVKRFWMHGGEIVSSRLAEAALAKKKPILEREKSKQLIKESIAGLVGANPSDVFLYPCGMAGLYHAYRVVAAAQPSRNSAQLGFAYVDTMKIPEHLGNGIHALKRGDEADLNYLEMLLDSNSVSAVFCEFPNNPLLRSVDLYRLSQMLRKAQVPLIVDDTIGSFVNVDVLPLVDFLATSLTKFFSGGGDVMGGSIVINPSSPIAASLRAAFEKEYEDLLWLDDAAILAANSRDYAERMEQVNSSAEALCEFLRDHPAVEQVYYPKFETPARYLAHKRPEGGFGGLFSILLKKPEVNAPRFYDALDVNKGPSLGANFTLVCPYTILAHYEELPWAEERGVSRWLIRVSVGLEPVDELIEKFREALAVLA